MKKVNNVSVSSKGSNGATNQGEALQSVEQSTEGQESAQNGSQSTETVKGVFENRKIPGFTVKGYNAVCVKARLNTL
jgi:hypothetical protein